MNLSDIIALAKQGYKPQDIKELIALAGSEDAGGGAGNEDAGGGAGNEDAGGGVGSKSEMEQLVDQLKKQNKNLQDALKRMDLSKNKKTESASDILKDTLINLF